MADRLAGRIVVVTGAAAGIGRAVAERFAAEAAGCLILIDRAFTRELREQMEASKSGGECRFVECDLGDPEAIDRTLPELFAGLGRVDVVVNNAGVSDENELADVAIWRKVMAVNLDGPYNVVRCAEPFFTKGGRVVNISSILGRAGKRRNTAYCASKHGLLGLTKALAMDFGPRGVTVNAVLPGWVETPLLDREIGIQASLLGLELGALKAKAARQIPIKRLVQSNEVADMVAFLCSPEAAAITAQGIVVDGGFMAGA